MLIIKLSVWLNKGKEFLISIKGETALTSNIVLSDFLSSWSKLQTPSFLLLVAESLLRPALLTNKSNLFVFCLINQQ